LAGTGHEMLADRMPGAVALRKSSGPFLVALQLAILACGDGSAGVPNANDSFAPEDLVPLACGAGQQTLPLTTIPAVGHQLTFFHRIGASCDPIDSTQILLSNDSASPISVDRIGASGDRFIARAAGLPRQIAPGEMLSVKIEFRSSEAGEIGSLVAVSGPDGCFSFLVTGSAWRGDVGVTSLSAYAMDFGGVEREAPSEIQELSFLEQPGGSSVDISTTGDFEVVGSLRTSRDADCVLTTARIRLTPQQRTGAVVGEAGVSVSSTFDGAQWEGFQLIELRANVQ
jgi:hypothetical protein